ncbi:MAG TPA: hypothetical protein VFL97_03235 [Nitrococcus sp.]|nr:hypothetical protein [Nitrococcus sp.]
MDSAPRDSVEADSKLLEALGEACRGLSITPVEVRDALAPEDVSAWRNDEITNGALRAFAQILVQRRGMDQGKRPNHYTECAICTHCGPIWLWFSGNVQGCPWCWNRMADRPIPRPHAVRCSECTHFERIEHPHLGRCAKDQLEPIAGLWNTDWRYCKRYMPRREPADSGSSGQGDI